MNYTTKHVLAICVALSLITSCKKNDYDGGNNTILANNTATILEVFHSTPTAFSITAGTTKEVLGPQGTLLRFYPHSFRDKNGNIISSGTVNIDLTEMYAAGDMLKYYTSTNSGSAVLNSGGEVLIKATMNGEEVTANKYGIGFNAVRTPTTGPRELFYGNTYATDGIVTWGGSGGAIGTAITGAGPVAGATIALPSGSYYMFDSCTSFNWVAGEHNYSGTSQNITVKVKLSNGSFAGNVWSVAYMGLSSERVATVLYQESFDRDSQTGVYKGWAPVGTSQKFMLIIPRDKNTWYYYKTEQLITDGVTINATLTEASKDEMDAVIKVF